MRKWVIFVLFLSWNLLAQNVPYKIIKDAKGEGWDYRNARLNAFRDAIEKSYGVQIDSKSTVKNFTEIADTILSTSQGIIQSYHGEKYQTNTDGSCIVTFAQVIVSESVKSITNDIQNIAGDLEHLNCPPIGIQDNQSDPDFVSYIQSFLVNDIGVKVVPPSNAECEMTIRPFLRIEGNGTMMVRGDVVNKKGEVVSSCANFKLLYQITEDKKFASDILVINLLMQFVITPTIKVTNIRSYPEAESLLETLRSVEELVAKCSLKTYQNNIAEYDVNIRGNLRQLCSELIKTGSFDPQKVTMNEFSRELIIAYIGKGKHSVLATTPETTTNSNNSKTEPPKNPEITPEVIPNSGNAENYSGFTYAGQKTFSCGPLSYTVDLYDHQKTGLRFVSLPPVGEAIPFSFTMGSPSQEINRTVSEQAHPVKFTKRFLISQTEVTQKVWEKIMGNNPSLFKDSPEYPVEMINWAEANDFCTRTGVSLPTEAQFEYALRGGSTQTFTFGETITPIQANFDGRYPYKNGEKGDFRGKTEKVQSFPPNAYGLYEMHGNVIEWCSDWFGTYSALLAIDPIGPPQGANYRVIRGGGWNSRAQNIRSASRGEGNLTQKMQNLGFRVCYQPK